MDIFPSTLLVVVESAGPARSDHDVARTAPPIQAHTQEASFNNF